MGQFQPIVQWTMQPTLNNLHVNSIVLVTFIYFMLDKLFISFYVDVMW